MFMSTTDDRNHIGNEWTSDKKLLEVDIRSNKWHETYQNVHFSSFRQLVGLAVGRWFICFAHRAGVIGQKNFFSLRGWKKKTFSHRFWWVGREPETRPCCGYSLEWHWRCVFNEYLQRVVWRKKQNYPLIITKYPRRDGRLLFWPRGPDCHQHNFNIVWIGIFSQNLGARPKI